MNALYTKTIGGDEALALSRASCSSLVANDMVVEDVQDEGNSVLLVLRERAHRISHADYLRLLALPAADGARC